MSFRLIIDKPKDAFTNMAIDKAILFAKQEPTLRFFQWKPPAVSIGCFQSLEEEVDTERCKLQGIDVVRRITGGGAVFHDKELTYSFVIAEENSLVPADLLGSYEKICSAVIAGLKNLGLKAGYAPLNDIVVNGRKISGCAQTRRNKAILHHGTLLMAVDVEKMFSLLKVPSEKIRDKMIATVQDRVTSIEKELGRGVSVEDLSNSLKKGFEQTFGIKLVLGKLGEEEWALVEQFREGFASSSWNNRR